MVQKTDKFTDQRLFSSRNATTSQKHFSFSIRKMALGDLPDELGSIMDSPVSPAQPNEARKTSDLAKLSGNKRQQPESSSTPVPNGSTCHLVYVRRKLETEHGKTNATSNENTSCSPGVRKSLEKIEAQPEQTGNPEEDHCKTVEQTGNPEEAHSKTMEQTGNPVEDHSKTMEQTGNSEEAHSKTMEQTGNPEEDHSKTIDEVSSHVNEPQIEILNYWTERFNVLQDHLQYLDKSGSKDYAEKFRNYSVEELNKYAVELEKRAIRLSLEEALQGKRVKDLNLMGKFS